MTNYHKLGGLKWQKFFSCSSGGQKSQIKLSAGFIPSGSSEENPFHAPTLLASSGCQPWCSFLVHASLQFLPPSSSYLLLSFSVFLLFIRTPVMRFGALPKSRMISSNDPELYLQRYFFQLRLHSQVERLRVDMSLEEGSIQPTISGEEWMSWNE